MIFGDVYKEITKRAGQGYGNFEDRAQAVFWKAVGLMIREGDYAKEELRLAAKRSENEAHLAHEFPYLLTNHTSIASHYVFSTEVELRPGEPQNIHYTKLSEQVLHRGAYLTPLGAAGIKEVYYSLKYPSVIIQFNDKDPVLATAWAYVTVTWTGVPRTLVEGSSQNSTPAYNYFTQQFIDRAIESAVKLMAQET